MNDKALTSLDGLGDAQKIAAIALAEGKTREEAAREAGVDRTTVFRWLRKPEFVAAYKSVAQLSMEALLGKAVSSIEAMLGSKNEWVRLGAARMIIDHVIPHVEAANSAIHVNFNMPQPALPTRLEADGGVE